MKTIIVTGGNRGIGLEICRQLDALGHKVILSSRDLDKCRQAASSISKNVIAQQLDVTDEISVRALFEYIRNEFGSLDVLINNAGLGSRHFEQGNVIVSGAKSMLKTKLPGTRQMIQLVKPIFRRSGMVARAKTCSDIPLDQVKYIMETNLYGPWRMIQTFLPLMEKGGNGRIINISSGMGEFGSLNSDYPDYRLSKSSLNILTLMLAEELINKGISINAMCPGWVKTDMGGPDAQREVGEGADTAVWLATEKIIPHGKFLRDRKTIDW